MVYEYKSLSFILFGCVYECTCIHLNIIAPSSSSYLRTRTSVHSSIGVKRNKWIQFLNLQQNSRIKWTKLERAKGTNRTHDKWNERKQKKKNEKKKIIEEMMKKEKKYWVWRETTTEWKWKWQQKLNWKKSETEKEKENKGLYHCIEKKLHRIDKTMRYQSREWRQHNRVGIIFIIVIVRMCFYIVAPVICFYAYRYVWRSLLFAFIFIFCHLESTSDTKTYPLYFSIRFIGEIADIMYLCKTLKGMWYQNKRQNVDRTKTHTKTKKKKWKSKNCYE